MSNSMNRRKRGLRDYQLAPMPQLALNSPPYYPPVHIHPESAVRFHQMPQSTHAAFQFNQPHNKADASLASNASALAGPYPAPAVLLPGPYREEPPPEDERERDSPLVANESRQVVDIIGDADGVYLVNCHADSYSTVLDDDEEATPAEKAQTEAQLELALMHLRKAQQLSNQRQQNSIDKRMVVGPSNLTQLQAPKDVQDRKCWQQDLKQRNVMRQIKAHIRAGGALSLECMALSNYTVQCTYTECIQPARLVPCDHFYIKIEVLGKPNNGKHICLECLEHLWNGDGMQTPLENPAVFSPKGRRVEVKVTKQAAPAINLDGQDDIDNERRDSALSLKDDDLACDCEPETNGKGQKGHEICNNQFTIPEAGHAGDDPERSGNIGPPRGAESDSHLSNSHNIIACDMSQSVKPSEWSPEEPKLGREHFSVWQPPLPSHQRSSSSDIKTFGTLIDRRTSQSSTDSDGNWRSPPTRFQRLAEFIQPGENLTRHDNAALHLWKAASKEQLRWQDHLERTEQLRRKFAGLLSDEEEEEEDWMYADVTLSGDSIINGAEDGEIVNKNMKAFNPVEGNKRDGEDENIVQLAGFVMKQCYGMDLSAALALSRDARAARV